jgi:uncharacterized protein (TIRG00374 family)
LKKKISKRLIIFFRSATAILLITFLVFSIGIKKLVLTFISVSLIPGLMTGFCLFILYLLGALNIWLLLNTNHTISFFPYLKQYSYSWMASLITPGQAGDASLAIFLKKYNIPIHSTGIIYIIDKIITLFFFLLIAICGSYLLFPELKSYFFQIITLIIVLPVLMTFLAIIFFRKTRWGKILNNRLNIEEMIIEFHTLKSKWHVFFVNFLITMIKWLVMTFAFFLAFQSFHVHVKFPDIGIIPIISTLVGYIPISIAGLGTVEITAGYLFSKVGIAQSVVLSAYLFLRSLQYMLALLILCILTFFDKSRHRKDEMICRLSGNHGQNNRENPK